MSSKYMMPSKIEHEEIQAIKPDLGITIIGNSHLPLLHGIKDFYDFRRRVRIVSIVIKYSGEYNK